MTASELVLATIVVDLIQLANAFPSMATAGTFVFSRTVALIALLLFVVHGQLYLFLALREARARDEGADAEHNVMPTNMLWLLIALLALSSNAATILALV